MKFEKEALSTAVKAKLTAGGKNLSMSERTLNDMVSNYYSFAGEETELDDFVTQVLPSFETIEGQLRHDYSNYTKEWEKTHPTPNPEPKPNPNPTPQTADPAVAELLKRIEAMENANKAAEAKLAIEAKRVELLDKLKEKGISNSEWVNNYMDGLAISADTDVAARVEAAAKLYNLTNAGTQIITPGNSGGGEPQSDKDLFADIAAMRKPKE